MDSKFQHVIFVYYLLLSPVTFYTLLNIIFRELEQFGADNNALMDEFERRCDMFKRGGTLVLRGFEIPTSTNQLQRIPTSVWKVLNWKDNIKPANGRYALPPDSKQENNIVSVFCEKYLKDEESDSTDGEGCD